MKLYDLKVNHLRNPLGFRMGRTVFTWKVSERMSLPVTIHETFLPKELLHTPAGELVFDMEQSRSLSLILRFLAIGMSRWKAFPI